MLTHIRKKAYIIMYSIYVICFGCLKTNIEISTTRGEAIQLFF